MSGSPENVITRQLVSTRCCGGSWLAGGGFVGRLTDLDWSLDRPQLRSLDRSQLRTEVPTFPLKGLRLQNQPMLVIQTELCTWRTISTNTTYLTVFGPWLTVLRRMEDQTLFLVSCFDGAKQKSFLPS